LGTYRFHPMNHHGCLASYVEEQENRMATGGIATNHSPTQESVWATLDIEGNCILREKFVVDFPNVPSPAFQLIRMGRRSSLIFKAGFWGDLSRRWSTFYVFRLGGKIPCKFRGCVGQFYFSFSLWT
jgi:hypothetical protein